MTTPGTFSHHASEQYESLEFVVYDQGEHRHIIGRCLFREHFGKDQVSEILMMARAKYLGRQFASGSCAEYALALIRSSEADAVHFWEEDEERERVLVDKVAKAMLTSLGEPDAYRSAATFCSILKISGSDEIFHAFHERWRPAAVPTEEMLLQAARDMEESLLEQFPNGYAEDFARIRSGSAPGIRPR
jgi:hypothetical protein